MGSHDNGGRKHSNRLHTHEWSEVKTFNVHFCIAFYYYIRTAFNKVKILLWPHLIFDIK